MADVNVALQQITREGLTASFTAMTTTDTYKLANSGRMFVAIKSGAAGAVNATFIIPGTVDGQAIGDRTVSIAAGAEVYFGPFTRDYNDASNKVSVTAAGAGLSIAGLRLD